MAIMKCDCLSKFQDNEYGSQMRVHTEGGGTTARKYTCTVCGKTKSGGSTPEKKKGKGEK